jgi:hypothetical protein
MARTEKPERRRIGVDNDLGVADQNGIGQGLNDLAESFLALAQRRFRLLAFGFH